MLACPVKDVSEVSDVSDARRAATTQRVRPAAVAGTWYPGTAAALTNAVDRLLALPAQTSSGPIGDLVALIAPHAGLKYSGPVAASAYQLLREHVFDLAVLVGPSH